MRDVILNLYVRQTNKSIVVRDIDDKIHLSSNYELINLFIKDLNNNNRVVIVKIVREVHVVNDLKIKMLIEINILKSENVVINLNLKKLRLKFEFIVELLISLI